MSRKLTKKQKAFVQAYGETGNGTQSALQAYDTTDENTAGVIASENLIKPKILSALEEAFPDNELFRIHREGLYEENALIRHKYLETAYKIKGKFKDGGGSDSNVLNITLIKYGDDKPSV